MRVDIKLLKLNYIHKIYLIQQAEYILVFPKGKLQALYLLLRKKKNFSTYSKQKKDSIINSTLMDLFLFSGRGCAYPIIIYQKLPENLLENVFLKGHSSIDARKLLIKLNFMNFFSQQNIIQLIPHLEGH